jgi:hypothetical protein
LSGFYNKTDACKLCSLSSFNAGCIEALASLIMHVESEPDNDLLLTVKDLTSGEVEKLCDFSGIINI